MATKKDKILRGFARIQLKNPDGSVAHETGFENNFCDGFRNQVLTAIGNGSGTVTKPSYIGIGTGSEPAVNAESIPGMLSDMAAVGESAVSVSTRLRLTGSFASNVATGDISNMGLYTSNTSNAGLICGNTFAASFAKASNQELSVTYDITFEN